MIHVIATIHIQPGRREDFLAAFHTLVPQIFTEAGVIEYGPAIDLPTSIQGQSPVRDDVVTVIEKWESVTALEAHLAAPHMAAYRETVKDMVSGVEIHVFRPA